MATKWTKRYSKYGNKKTVYNGVKYHSKAEAKYAQELDLLKRAGEIKDWEGQLKVELTAYGQHIANYFVDFIIKHNDGTLELVEVKGRGVVTSTWRIKWKFLMAKYKAGELGEDMREPRVEYR